MRNEPLNENSEPLQWLCTGKVSPACRTEAELAAANARIAELEAATPTPEETKLDASGIPIGGVAASAIEDAQKPGMAPNLLAFKTPKKR